MALHKKEIVIFSDKMNLDQVEVFIVQIFDQLKLEINLFYKVLLCVNEAVMNSIAHGNLYDGNKKVIVQSFFCKEYLFFRIIDEGVGFNYLDLPDPTSEDNILRETGRGIYIIKNISDEIIFREKGNIVEFKISIDGKNTVLL